MPFVNDTNNTNEEMQLLLDRMEGCSAGDFISHDEIAKLVRCEYNSSRYQSIVQRWRGYMLKAYNILMKNVLYKGYIVADSEKRLHHCIKEHRGAAKKTKRAAAVLGATDKSTLSDENKSVYDHRLKFIVADVFSHENGLRQLKIDQKRLALINGEDSD